ncbi:serine hydrolase domain-containing protein [Streptomyces sp. NPDC058195]|uniref:serine hydrolase domain-containing protein n=1 Tax=Streptomyces sp. NPDC058195 TaxID=3346375 RepID=UPI0036E367A8
MRILRTAGTVIAASLLLTAAPVTSAGAAPRAAATSAPTSSSGAALDPTALSDSLLAVHEAGMYGVYSTVSDGARSWAGASGLADVKTGRPVTSGMRHRAGSISKTFAAVAVLQQVERGRIHLDTPIGDYLPDLIPGERGRQITVRMLLNHTSGIGDYITGAFPSLAHGSPASLDEERYRSISPRELVRLGLTAPATGAPGAEPGHYSNTNYVIIGLLLAKVTGQAPETYITQHVIDRAGLHRTSYPDSTGIQGPHARMYENFYGLIDPPRDYSVYDMSWAYTAGTVVSTTDDLNRFYRALLTGRLIGPAALKEMQRTVSVNGTDYGLGLFAVDVPGCGRFWGHDGAVFGAGTIALSSPDGRRQVATGWNLTKYERINADGTGFEPSPINDALNRYVIGALCPAYATGPSPTNSATPAPTVLTGPDLSLESWAVGPH